MINALHSVLFCDSSVKRKNKKKRKKRNSNTVHESDLFCNLADRVSAKVRELDLAQSRVNSTLLRLDAIVERTNCINGVTTALDSQDYESAAGFVRRFLQIESEYSDSSSDQRDQLMESKKLLESIVKKKLSAAVGWRDHSEVLRFIKLYTPLGIEEEGLQAYVTYLRKVIGMRSWIEFENLMELVQQKSPQVNFVTCLTNLFKDIVLAIEENDEILRGLCGEDGIVYATHELQEECDSNLQSEYASARDKRHEFVSGFLV